MPPNAEAALVMIAVVRYQDCHFEGVSALWREAFPNDNPWNLPDIAIPAKMKFQPELFLVAVEGSLVTGSIMAGYEGHRGWISRIAVRKDHRAKGVGRELLRQAEHRLAGLGCIKVNLQVVALNASTTEFYARSGYGVEERISMSKLLRRV